MIHLNNCNQMIRIKGEEREMLWWLTGVVSLFHKEFKILKSSIAFYLDQVKT